MSESNSRDHRRGREGSSEGNRGHNRSGAASLKNVVAHRGVVKSAAVIAVMSAAMIESAMVVIRTKPRIRSVRATVRSVSTAA